MSDSTSNPGPLSVTFALDAVGKAFEANNQVLVMVPHGRHLQFKLLVKVLQTQAMGQ